MNIFKRIYCRIYQKAFHLALPFLPYRNPKIAKTLDKVPGVLSHHNLSRPLLITDSVIRGNGLTQQLENDLADQNMTPVVFDRVLPNPTTDMVEDAYQVYLENDCDCLICFGGGSVMDCAKAVGVRAARPNTSLVKMGGLLKVRRGLPPVIAVPTTAGTGSETTLAAVIVDSETRHKFTINDFALIPSYAVLDPAVIHGLPANIAAATGMDALTHAVEAYIGRSTTRSTRKDAETAVSLIFHYIDDAVSHTSTRAEEGMLIASHYAGRAFTRSYVGYVHAVSHSLSGRYNMPHGLVNAVLLPIVLDMYMAGSTDPEHISGRIEQKTAGARRRLCKKLANLAVLTGLGKASDEPEILARRFTDAIYAMNKRLGIPDHLDGIEEDDIREMAAHADHEANPLYPVPILWNAKELSAIYRKVMNHGENNA